MENKKQTLTIACLVLGIVGIVFDFIYTVVGLILGIVGLVLAVQARKKEGASGMSTAGLVCSIVAIALGAVMLACAVCVVGSFVSAFAAL